ncbi:MAG: PilZ domain-containing protein [Gammaproteobacteria bacterium]|nr:PilZ domain-containing protein [Gammaproteobacteria bacterium]
MPQSQQIQTRRHRADIQPEHAWAVRQARAPAALRPDSMVAQPRGYRTSLRKQIRFETLVNCGMTYSLPWHIINLGLGGALVEMDRTKLQVGTTFEFKLCFTHHGRSVEHRIPARVVRIGSRGVAVQFGDYDDAAYTDLTDFLYDIEE